MISNKASNEYGSGPARAYSVKECNSVTHGLGNPSKMPGASYGLPASECIAGSRFRQIPGTICSKCYASDRGFYQQKTVKDCQRRRFASIDHPEWVPMMAFLIGRLSEPYFRWHDSGDLKSIEHLLKIFEVCRLTKKVRHWLPTQERRMVTVDRPEPVPVNCVVRISAVYIGQRPTIILPEDRVLASTAGCHAPGVFQCPARKQGNKCGDCRRCWSIRTHVVSYDLH